MLGERYDVMTVECPRCKTKQKVYVVARAGFGQMGEETIQCIRCDLHFNVSVPDRIVGGPFPA
jgi:hypothetical protein